LRCPTATAMFDGPCPFGMDTGNGCTAELRAECKSGALAKKMQPVYVAHDMPGLPPQLGGHPQHANCRCTRPTNAGYFSQQPQVGAPFYGTNGEVVGTVLAVEPGHSSMTAVAQVRVGPQGLGSDHAITEKVRASVTQRLGRTVGDMLKRWLLC
jgi:hypothetical protein